MALHLFTQNTGQNWGGGQEGRRSDAERMGGDVRGVERPGAFPSRSALNARCHCAGGRLGLQKKPEKPWMLQPRHSRINHWGFAAF